jgi:hypothetical protein
MGFGSARKWEDHRFPKNREYHGLLHLPANLSLEVSSETEADTSVQKLHRVLRTQLGSHCFTARHVLALTSSQVEDFAWEATTRAGRVHDLAQTLFQTAPEDGFKKSGLVILACPQNVLMPTSTISIVTPSFNQGMFIERTVRSVLGQGYPKLEYVVMDGGSTDNTLNLSDRLKNLMGYLGSIENQEQNGRLKWHRKTQVHFGLIADERSQICRLVLIKQREYKDSPTGFENRFEQEPREGTEITDYSDSARYVTPAFC